MARVWRTLGVKQCRATNLPWFKWSPVVGNHWLRWLQMHSFQGKYPHLIIQTICLCKKVIFPQGSNKVSGWCNPDPSSPRVWAKAEQFPCSCQSDAPHCSVVFIADETARCRWPLSSLMGAKAVSQEPTSKTHTNAHACTHTDFYNLQRALKNDSQSPLSWERES